MDTRFTQTNLTTSPTHKRINKRTHAQPRDDSPEPTEPRDARVATNHRTPLTRSSAVMMTVKATAPRRGSSEDTVPVTNFILTRNKSSHKCKCATRTADGDAAKDPRNETHADGERRDNQMRKCGETLGTCLGTREGAGRHSQNPITHHTFR